MRPITRCAVVALVLSVAAAATPGAAESAPELHAFDVRGSAGLPRGTRMRAPTAGQLRAIDALEKEIGAEVVVRYNGLTATPNHLFSYHAYLTRPSERPAESVARGFLDRWRAIVRFDDRDLANLRLKTRAFVPDIATTILLFQQVADGLPVHRGEVLVNVNRDGRVISVGSDSYPQLRVRGHFSITTPTRNARRVVFPLGDVGRRAYDFTKKDGPTTWRVIVDAADGRVLRREPLTASLGPRGGGVGVGRTASFRPDIQDFVESLGADGSAAGKVFDGTPTVLSGVGGFGRPRQVGDAPRYASEGAMDAADGRGFRASLVFAHTVSPLVYDPPYGQVLRGLPDALHPTTASRFGWFYLPTASAAREIASTKSSYARTRGYGYKMSSEAARRNPSSNAPASGGRQPFAVARAKLPRTVKTADGRRLSAVFESKYAEGNNAVVADDRAADSEETMGIRAYAADRRFVADRFDFRDAYELGGVDAGGTSDDPLQLERPSDFFPKSTDTDLLPGAVSLFYFANVMHDYLYDLGFTEPLWNFQQDNFGRGGRGADGLRVHLQSGFGTDNATFSTTPDGENPHMDVYLNTDGGSRRSDNAFEFDTIAHEYFHGVSTRSVGKGHTGCLGAFFTGEAGGQGEGWSDYIPASMADDDAMFEFSGGEFDTSFRRLPLTNYRWSYGALNGFANVRRDSSVPDVPTERFTIPFETHDIGEMWAATLWDMRELMIARHPSGLFFDGKRRLGDGKRYFIGDRALRSVDDAHPIDYRARFNTADKWTVKGSQIKRPRLLASEIAKRGDRTGPLAEAVRTSGRLADTLVLRGMQLSPCNPSFVQSRDSILLADRELTGGENAALIWRAFASHGVGAAADSTTRLGGEITDAAPVVIDDHSVPPTVAKCESVGAHRAPPFTAAHGPAGVEVEINGGKAIKGAKEYVVWRSSNADGPYVRLATLEASRTTLVDQSAQLGKTYFYRVRTVRNPDCVSTARTKRAA